MAKLRGAKKAAFLRRMARGRAKAHRRVNRGHSVRRRRPMLRARRIGFRRNPAALIANPGLFPAVLMNPTRRKRRKSKMAKKRRASKRRASPRRRRRAHARRRYTTFRPSRKRARGRRSRKRVILINPRRRRSHRRRRNPGGGNIMAIVKRAFVPYAVGVGTAGAAAMLDTALSGMPAVRQIVKVGGALLIAATFGRRNPIAGAAAIGALGATQGYPLVTKLAGGMIARTPTEAVKGLGEMTQTYPEMGALLQGGVGALLQGMGGPPDTDTAVVNYETALQNMADDDDY